jgi:hypothetical protein
MKKALAKTASDEVERFFATAAKRFGNIAAGS